MAEPGTLFVCATPIGNLEDLTFRAKRILQEVDLICAEDTRQTRKLLDHYKIDTPQTSYHKFNIRAKTGYLISILKEGKSLALVSDAGVPGISDPGYEVINEAIAQGINVVAIPGASALVSALSVSGLSTENFMFLGFLPKKPGKRRKALKDLTDAQATLIIYESPHRMLKCLKDVEAVLGDRNIVVARELTKKFEEVLRGKVSKIIIEWENSPRKGEMVLLIEGTPKKRLSRER